MRLAGLMNVQGISGKWSRRCLKTKPVSVHRFLIVSRSLAGDFGDRVHQGKSTHIGVDRLGAALDRCGFGGIMPRQPSASLFLGDFYAPTLDRPNRPQPDALRRPPQSISHHAAKDIPHNEQRIPKSTDRERVLAVPQNRYRLKLLRLNRSHVATRVRSSEKTENSFPFNAGFRKSGNAATASCESLASPLLASIRGFLPSQSTPSTELATISTSTVPKDVNPAQ